MELRLYITIIRQSWLIILLTALLAGSISLVMGFTQPAGYTAMAHVLVTFADPARVDIEDPLAYDVAAIVTGRPFGTDVAARMVAQGYTITPDQVMTSLSATNRKREVWLTAHTPDERLPIPLLEAAVKQLIHGGLRYWGAAPIVAEQPGLSIVILDMPTQAQPTNGITHILRDTGLRLLAGAALGVAIAFVRHYWKAT